jgi:hypothetical protein
LNICGAWEGFLFEFASLNGVWKFGSILLLGRGPLVSALFPLLTSRDGHPVPCAALFLVTTLTAQRVARCRWPPAVAAALELASLSLNMDITREGHRAFRFPVAPFDYLIFTALLHINRRFARRCQPPPSCLTRPKEEPQQCTPPTPRTYPRHRLMKPGNGSSPTIVFPYDHPTGGSLLQLFPIPDMNSALPRSTSLTTSLAASTTPSAPHRCLLPVDVRTTVE